MKDISKYAKIDPAFFTDGLFVPKANKNKAISIEREWDNGIVRFRGVQLGVAHQSVLLALCARVGRNGEIVVKGTKRDLHGMQIDLHDLEMDLLKCFDDAKNSPTAVVEASAYSILVDAGMHDSGTSYDRLIQYLVDMQTLVVYRQMKSSKKGGGSNLLNFSHEGDRFRISVNWRLANAILGESHYVQISLFERNQLSDPVAKILHAWLSSNIRLGQSLGFGNGVLLDSLICHVWGDDDVSQETIRQRRRRLIKALNDINGVNNWVCLNQGKKWLITRPIDLGNDWLGSPGELKEAERMSCMYG